MESAKMTRAERRWVITELFSFFFFFATASEDEHGDEEVEEDDNDGGDEEGDDDADEEEYLELEVEGQDKAAAYSSHCEPGFVC